MAVNDREREQAASKRKHNQEARKRSRANMLARRQNGEVRRETLEKRHDLSLRECGDLAFLKRQTLQVQA